METEILTKYEEVQNALAAVDDVLDMSRIESGRVKIEEKNVHIPDVLHDLRTIIQGNVAAKRQDLYIDTQDVVHEDIITDKLRLNQVLLNLVSNAIKFTPAGGTISIRVSEKPCEMKQYTTYEFRIKDNGIGMSKEFQKEIFDSFTRESTSTTSGIQGTGLGMAITKNIVDMMGGTIEVKSEEGKGSEFIVCLSCRVSGRVMRYEPVPQLRGARALVVDDDTNTCMSVSKMLRGIEMRPDWTTSGKEAVIRAQEAYEEKDEFKAFIIDWLMPDMNGIETVRRIRKVIGESVPIIILTAYDWADIEEEAKEAGVTAFVAKPLFMSELRSALVEEPEKLVGSGQFQGKKVLLVEDNELILMDVQMPQMDGYTATREIRTLSDNRKANIPIIAMTANAFEEDKEKAFAAGMDDHIAKPIDIHILLDTLNKIFSPCE